MTSTVEWHRYGERRPDDEATCLVFPEKSAPAVLVYEPPQPAAKARWTAPRRINPCRPDDLWCHLPVPPNGGEE